jgi:hypothetical protein
MKLQFVRIPRGFRRSGFALVALAGLWCGSAPPAAADDPNTADVGSYFSREAKRKGERPTSLTLRPNTEEAVFLFLYNDTGGEQDRKVSLSALVSKGSQTEALPIAETKDFIKLESGQQGAKVRFAAPLPSGAPIPPAKFDPLGGPPYKLRVELSNRDGKKTVEDVAITIRQPSQYIDVTRSPYFTWDPATRSGTLTATVKANPQFDGPPCKVELDLRPEEIRGLELGPKTGVYSRALDRAGQEVQLVAEGLRFTSDQGPPTGRVYLTVDGYERAYVYTVAFSTTNEGQRVTTPEVRVSRPEIRSKPLKQVGYQLLVDNLSAVGFLEVDLFRRPGGEPEVVEKLPSPRQSKVELYAADPGPSGALLFKTHVADWAVSLNTEGIYGRAEVRVRMLESDGKPVTVAVRDEGGNRREEYVEAVGRLFFDNTPPIDVAFDDQYPQQMERNSQLVVRATGRDPETGISRVVFFLGKPVKDPKTGVEGPGPSVETVPGELVAGTDWWEAVLPVSTGKPDTFFVSAEVVNGADQSTIKTIRIELVDRPAGAAGAAAKATFSVEGVVREGERPQPGLDVALKDPKGTVLATAKTGTGAKGGKPVGVFKFESVPPGAYVITAVKMGALPSKGNVAVTVVDRDVKKEEVEITLTR